MQPIDTGKAYDQITHLWQREGFDRTNGIAQHEKALSYVKSSGLALDIGCGCTGRFIDLLLSHGFTPQGIDISQKMLQLAQERHPNIEFIHADICQWQTANQYDFITAWDSIWHVPLSLQEALMIKLMSMLTKDGVLIFSAGGIEEPQQHTDDAMGVEVYYGTLGYKKLLALIEQCSCVCHYVEYELHCYFIVQRT